MIKLKIDPKPDFGRFEQVLRRAGEPDRVPFYELFSNIQDEVLEAIGWEGDADTRYPEDLLLQRHTAYMFHLGYDYVNVRPPNFRFPTVVRPTVMTPYGERRFLTGDTCTIADREAFETYPWPEVESVDFTPFERVVKWMPDGMKVVTMGPGGVLENTMWLLGYEGISYKLHDDPELVRDVFDAVGERLVAYADAVASLEVVGAFALGDDMGFRTQTLLSPAVYREHLFPWYRKLVAAVHRHGKPVILHSCGNLSEVMEDVISCGWDARHSFEDAIQPVWEAKRAYGDRIAMLGGFDMDKLCRMSESEVRAHTRFMVEQCAPGGDWMLGTGNSVADYVPVRNFLAMLEEGFQAGRY